MAVEGHQAVQYEAGTQLAAALTLNDGTVLAAGTVLQETVKIQDLAALNVFYFALALIVVGVGLSQGPISRPLSVSSTLRTIRGGTPGFTIFYMGINIGSFTATLLCGYLGETYGWGYGFGAAGIGMLFGLATFLWGQRHLHGHADPDDPELLKEKVFAGLSREWLILPGFDPQSRCLLAGGSARTRGLYHPADPAGGGRWRPGGLCHFSGHPGGDAANGGADGVDRLDHCFLGTV